MTFLLLFFRVSLLHFFLLLSILFPLFICHLQQLYFCIRSILFLCAATCTLIASQALPLTLQVDPDSPTYLVLSLHPELAESHVAVFLILSGLLLTAASVNVLPLKQPLSRVLFLFAFSYCAARTLLGWGFPLALNANSPHHGALQLPWLFCFSTAFTASSVAVHSSITVKPKSKAKDGQDSDSSVFTLGSVLFILFASIPFAALVFTTVTKTGRENLLGILWSAAVSNGVLAVCVRSSELFREVRSRGTAGADRRNLGINASSASMCVMTSMLGIGWTFGASLITPSVSSDITVPLSCLLLLCIKRTMLKSHIHPMALAATAASVWWLTSAMYSIFVRGYAEQIGISHFELNVGIFHEENVSIWNSSSLWYPGLNLLLMFVPLPAIYLGFLRRKGESEDILFILALLSLVPVLAAQCSSIRLLGVTGVIFGSWRCYDVGQKQADSNKLI